MNGSSMFQYCPPHKAREIRRGDNFDAKFLGGNTLDFDDLFSTKKHLGSIDGRDFPCQSRGNRTHFLRITRGHQGLQSTNIFSACNFQLQVWALQIKIQLFFSQPKQLAPPSTGVLLMVSLHGCDSAFLLYTFHLCLKYLSCVPLVHSLFCLYLHFLLVWFLGMSP